jgi:tetratricopeptide (TPR) repeat protein
MHDITLGVLVSLLTVAFFRPRAWRTVKTVRRLVGWFFRPADGFDRRVEAMGASLVDDDVATPEPEPEPAVDSVGATAAASEPASGRHRARLADDGSGAAAAVPEPAPAGGVREAVLMTPGGGDIKKGVRTLCAHCGSPDAQDQCTCNLVRYCGKACQKAHWPTHRVTCQQSRKLNAVAARSKEQQTAATLKSDVLAMHDTYFVYGGDDTTRCSSYIEEDDMVAAFKERHRDLCSEYRALGYATLHELLECEDLEHATTQAMLRVAATQKTARSAMETGARASNEECTICLEATSPTDVFILGCGHSFHRPCIAQLRENCPTGDKCPVCRKHLPPKAEKFRAQAMSLIARGQLRYSYCQGAQEDGCSTKLASLEMYKHAVKLLQQALADLPSDGEIHGNLAWAQGLLGDEEAQYQSNKRAVELIPQVAWAHINFAGCQANYKGDLLAALVSLRRGIKLDPEYSNGHYNLGVCLNMLGKPAAAIASWKQAVRTSSTGDEDVEARAHERLGWAHLHLGDAANIDTAVKMLQNAIALRPNYAEAHGNMGRALARKGDDLGAIAAYKRALALRPDDINTTLLLGSAQADAGDIDEAIATMERAITHDPSSSEAHTALGVVIGNHVTESICGTGSNFDSDGVYSGIRDYEEACALAASLRASIAAFKRGFTLDPPTFVSEMNIHQAHFFIHNIAGLADLGSEHGVADWVNAADAELEDLQQKFPAEMRILERDRELKEEQGTCGGGLWAPAAVQPET